MFVKTVAEKNEFVTSSDAVDSLFVSMRLVLTQLWSASKNASREIWQTVELSPPSVTTSLK